MSDVKRMRARLAEIHDSWAGEDSTQRENFADLADEAIDALVDEQATGFAMSADLERDRAEIERLQAIVAAADALREACDTFGQHDDRCRATREVWGGRCLCPFGKLVAAREAYDRARGER